jgi:hypothetical protein
LWSGSPVPTNVGGKSRKKSKQKVEIKLEEKKLKIGIDLMTYPFLKQLLYPSL